MYWPLPSCASCVRSRFRFFGLSSAARLAVLMRSFPLLETGLADGGSAGELGAWLSLTLGWQLELVRHPGADAKGLGPRGTTSGGLSGTSAAPAVVMFPASWPDVETRAAPTSSSSLATAAASYRAAGSICSSTESRVPNTTSLQVPCPAASSTAGPCASIWLGEATRP
jgi:hypothetical protein